MSYVDMIPQNGFSRYCQCKSLYGLYPEPNITDEMDIYFQTIDIDKIMEWFHSYIIE